VCGDVRLQKASCDQSLDTFLDTVFLTDFFVSDFIGYRLLMSSHRPLEPFEELARVFFRVVTLE
jgi:hypothetical protein